MKKHKTLLIALAASICMLTLIFDSRSALLASQNAIAACLRSVIPSLFPFVVLSSILCKTLTGRSLSFLTPLTKRMGIPKGCESIWLIGILGGYPIGAKCINEACNDGIITSATGRKLQSFCNNAGPAFIFGVLGPIIGDLRLTWILWIVHISASILTSLILSSPSKSVCRCKNTQIKMADILPNSVRSMSTICAWVIVFRIILTFFQRWFLWLLPQQMQVIIAGILELTNGAILLEKIPVVGDRLIISSAILGFGGLCILMQTLSVSCKTGLGFYFPGKVLHSLISVIFIYIIQLWILPNYQRSHISPFVIAAILIQIIASIIIRFKKVVAFRE